MSNHSATSDLRILHGRPSLVLMGASSAGTDLHVIEITAGQLEKVITFVEDEVRDNSHRLSDYEIELAERADELLCRSDLDGEQTFVLAATLVALHGPVGKTVSLFQNAPELAGVVFIDREAAAVTISSAPVTTTVLRRDATGPGAVH